MMIVASDLDRTLIYSSRALTELGCPFGTKLKPVESRDGVWMSFMSEDSFTLLQEVCGKYLFIPITTRTTNQYKRIEIFQKELPLPYAITTNGAAILKNGEPIKEWSELIALKMKKEAALLEEMRSLLQQKGIYLEGKIKQVEEYFFYYILDNPLPAKDVQELSYTVGLFGWRVSLQGRKLYFIPKIINKGDALQFICSYEGKDVIAGSGDSILDWDFLKSCRFRLVPNHGELAQVQAADFLITKKSGILAGEEILNQYLSL